MNEIVKEMAQYIIENPTCSYYGLKEYAYRNEKLDWLEVLNKKNIRSFIAKLCKAARRSAGKPYDKNMAEQIETLLISQEEYEEGNNEDAYQ